MMFTSLAEIIAVASGNEARDRIETPARKLGKARGAEPEPMKVSGVSIPKKCRFQKLAGWFSLELSGPSHTPGIVWWTPESRFSPD